MNLSQIQDIQYLFHNIFKDSSKKLVVKLNNELVTADFIAFDDWGKPTILDTEDEAKNDKYCQRFNSLRASFFELLSGYQTIPSYLKNNQALLLTKMVNMVKSNFYDFHESIIYNVNFLETDQKYDFLLVSDNDEFEVISLID